MKIIGHRGAKGIAPENTIAGFQKALDSKVDYIEFDVTLTADNKPVVFHDYELNRITGMNGRIFSMTYEELEIFDVGKWFGEEFKGQHIPTLKEALEFIIPKAIPIIELKMDYIRARGLEDIVIEQCKEFVTHSEIIIISFFHPALLKIKENIPIIKTGIIYNSALMSPWKVARSVKADSIHPRMDVISKSIVERCHNFNLKVRPWTANNEREYEYLNMMEVDALATDYPNRLYKYLHSK